MTLDTVVKSLPAMPCFMDMITNFEIIHYNVNFEGFTAVMFEVEVFWVVTSLVLR
jgi:hypothetical protein